MKAKQNPLRGQVIDALVQAGRPLTRGELSGFHVHHTTAGALQQTLDGLILDGLIVQTTVPDERRWAPPCIAYQARTVRTQGRLL